MITSTRGNTEKTSSSEIAKTAFASVIATTVEWYDFFAYGYMAGIYFGKLFFPQFDPATSILLAFVTFGVGFVARPVGSLIFGYFGDRLGRREVLVWTMVVMGIGTVAIGLTPTYSQVGILGGVLIAVFRFVQGLGIGGQWGGASTWVLERAHSSRHRAFWTSWVQMGVPFGLVFASGLVLVLRSTYPEAAFTSGAIDAAWRLPFYVGAFVILIGLIVRLLFLESPLFDEIKKAGEIVGNPITEAFRKDARTILRSMFVRSGENANFYIYSTFGPVFIINVAEQMNLSRSSLIAMLGGYDPTFFATIAAVVEIPCMIIFALLADRIGRKKTFLVSYALMVVASISFGSLLITLAFLPILFAFVVFAIVHAGAYAPQSAYFTELYKTRYRYTASGITYQLPSVFAGGLAPILISAGISYLAGGSFAGGWWVVSGVAVIYTVISLVATAFSEETREVRVRGSN